MTEIFEKYYNQSLSKSERIEFENRMTSDKEFAQEYQAYEMMMEHLVSKEGIGTALEALNDVHNEEEREPTKSNSKLFKYILWVLIIAIFGYIMYSGYTDAKKRAPEPKEIFAANFEPAPVSLSVKSNNMAESLAQVNLDYSEGKHIRVINALYPMNIDSIGDNRLYLMLGSSFINNGFYKEAREALRPLEALDQFRNDYYWYMAMSYLPENNVEEAKKNLQKIPSDSNYYKRVEDILALID